MHAGTHRGLVRDHASVNQINRRDDPELTDDAGQIDICTSRYLSLPLHPLALFFVTPLPLYLIM